MEGVYIILWSEGLFSPWERRSRIGSSEMDSAEARSRFWLVRFDRSDDDGLAKIEVPLLLTRNVLVSLGLFVCDRAPQRLHPSVVVFVTHGFAFVRDNSSWIQYALPMRDRVSVVSTGGLGAVDVSALITLP